MPTTVSSIPLGHTCPPTGPVDGCGHPVGGGDVVDVDQQGAVAIGTDPGGHGRRSFTGAVVS